MRTLHEPSWDEARLAATLSCTPLSSEAILISDAVDRFSATNIFSLCDLPTYTTSAMDGYALSGNGPWKIIGEVLAGEPFAGEVKPGEALRIATGAVIPLGVDTVIEWEKAEVFEGEVRATPRYGAHIRPAGAECRAGDLLLSTGQQISPGMAGLLAAAGHDQILVTKKPRTAILYLGDELLHSGIPHDGKVRDSIGPQLKSWLTRLGVEVVSQKYIPDSLPALIEAIEDSTSFDLIITTGGTADGPRDHIHPALDAIGATYIVDRVRSRPGHPTLLARKGDTTFLGLPGNPQSAIVGLMTLGAPTIAALLGQPIKELPSVLTRSELSAPENFNRLVHGTLVDGEFIQGDHLGSAMLRGLAIATGFAIAPAGKTTPGSLIRWLSLP